MNSSKVFNGPRQLLRPNPVPNLAPNVPCAIIKNGVWLGRVIYGNIYGDIRKRFPDGEAIHTSQIVDRLSIDLFQTLHAIYKVEFSPDGMKYAPIQFKEIPNAN